MSALSPAERETQPADGDLRRQYKRLRELYAEAARQIAAEKKAIDAEYDRMEEES